MLQRNLEGQFLISPTFNKYSSPLSSRSSSLTVLYFSTVKFSQGGESTHAYILLRGKLLVFTANDRYEAPQLKAYISEDRMAALMKRSPVHDQQFIHSCFNWFDQKGRFKHYYLNQICQGSLFGELGIVKNKQRSATVISNQQSYILKIKAEDYLRYFKSESITDHKEKANLLSNFFKLSNINMSNIDIFYSFQKREFILGQRIFLEGEMARHLFFLIEGQIQLQKNFQIIDRGKKLIKPICLVRVAPVNIFGFEVLQNSSYRKSKANNERFCSAVVKSNKALVYFNDKSFIQHLQLICPDSVQKILEIGIKRLNDYRIIQNSIQNSLKKATQQMRQVRSQVRLRLQKLPMKVQEYLRLPVLQTKQKIIRSERHGKARSNAQF